MATERSQAANSQHLLRIHDPRRQGMTLVEILVVLAIVGVATGAVILGLGTVDRDIAAQTEANRFADRLRLAADDVLVAGRPLTLIVEDAGYAFQADPTAGGERGLTDALSDRHTLPSGVRLAGPEGREGNGGGDRQGRTRNLLIDPDSASPVATFAFRKGSAVWSVRFDGLNAVVAASPAGTRP